MCRGSKELSEFQFACQNFYICFYFASIGLTQKGSELNNSGTPEAEIIIGTGHPDKEYWHSRLKITHVKEASKKDGIYNDTLAKSFTTKCKWSFLGRALVGDFRPISETPKFRKGCFVYATTDAAVGGVETGCCALFLILDLKLALTGLSHLRSPKPKKCNLSLRRSPDYVVRHRWSAIKRMVDAHWTEVSPVFA